MLEANELKSRQTTTFCYNMPFADEELFQRSQQHNVLQFCQWAKSFLSFLAEKRRHSVSFPSLAEHPCRIFHPRSHFSEGI